MTALAATAVGWLLTYLLHSSLLLLLTWLLDRTLAPRGVRSVGVREGWWRLAVWLPLASASLVMAWQPGLLPQQSSPAMTRASRVDVLEEAPRTTASRLVAPGSFRQPGSAGEPLSELPTAGQLPNATAAEPAPSGLLLSGDGLRLVLIIWLLPVVWLWLRLGRQWWCARRTTTRLPRVLDAGWLTLAAELTPRRPVLLRADSRARSPVAGPGWQVVLPDWVLALDCPLQRRAVLAHELHHIDRGDPRRRLVQETLAAWLWPQPLLRLAITRLEALAELDCDARATPAPDSAHALARCLLTCADYLRKDLTPPAPRWPAPGTFQPAMATTRSPLGERLQHLLDPDTEYTAMPHIANHRLRNRMLRLATALFALTGATMMLPAIAVAPAEAPRDEAPPVPMLAGAAAPAPRAAPVIQALPAAAGAPAPRGEPAAAAVQSGHAAPAVAAVTAVLAQASVSAHGAQRISMQRNGGHDGAQVHIELGVAPRVLTAHFNGKPGFNAVGDTLLTLAGGESAWIDDQRSTPRRRVDFSAVGDGLAMRYRVDDTEQPLDAAGRQWLQATTLELVRETALEVEQRIARLLDAGGVAAVLAEVQHIRSSHARGSHLRQLAHQTTLSDAEQARFLDLSRQLEADYDRRQVLLALLHRHDLDPAQQVRVLAASNGIASDYEKRQILAALAGRMALNDPQVRAAWQQAMQDLGSSYERRQAIAGLTARQDLDEAALAVVLEAIARIGSDYEQRVSLEALAPRLGKTGPLAARYAEATRRIGSDYEQRQALSALLDSGSESPDLWPALLAATAHIGSDYERRQLLVAIAMHMPDDPDLIARYRQLAAELGDYERGLAERALLDEVL